MSIYDFTVLDTKKNEVKLEDYKGKVLLVVNTATGCGFTPQYEALENLYKKYKDQGLVILDFSAEMQFGAFLQMQADTRLEFDPAGGPHPGRDHHHTASPGGHPVDGGLDIPGGQSCAVHGHRHAAWRELRSGDAAHVEGRRDRFDLVG